MSRDATRLRRLHRALPQVNALLLRGRWFVLLSPFGSRRVGVPAVEFPPARKRGDGPLRPSLPGPGEGGFVLASPKADPLDYHRLLQLVAHLRRRCQELYDQDTAAVRWKCSPIRVHRNDRGQSFDLISSKVSGVRVRAGVFLNAQRKLILRVARHRGTDNQSSESPLELPLRSLTESSSQEVTDHCVDVLNGVLREGSVDQPSAGAKRLASQLQMWDELLDRVEQVWRETVQLDRAEAIRANRFDVEFPGQIVGSGRRIAVSMKLMNWAELGESPCWIVIGRGGSDPPQVHPPADLTPVCRASQWYVPVPLSGDADVFAKAFKSRLKRALQCCARE